ncbi:MAG TPA: acyl-CoA dehydrogenase [Candidatus Hydrogenedentes bacterium]|nr:acyl-CoA dehydrogenase [Candidatus Hydrogenedentota bacterium]
MTTSLEHRGASYLFQDAGPEEITTPEDMDEEQRMMMKSIRDFAEQEVMPVIDEVNARNIDVVRPLFKKAADLGIYMAEVPEEYGGLGLGVLGIAGMMESRSYLGSLSSTVFAHQGIGSLPLINFGTQEQVDKYLEPLMTGEMMAAFALTEPSSGSDAMNIKSTATLNEAGTHYIVNGSKQWITNAGWADLFILFAKVDGQQFTAFLMERGFGGVNVQKNEDLLGIRGSSVCAIILEDVPIPVENVLGEVGKGHLVALCTLNLGRMKMATNCVGGGKNALIVAAKYAKERFSQGNPIAEFGIIQQKLADMAMRLYASQSAAYRTAGHVYHAIEAMGEEEKKTVDAKLKAMAEFSIECAFSKTHGSEMVNILADHALQIHGGYGYSEEYEPAKMFRDWRISRIYEGTSEICRLSSMKAMFRKARRGELDMESAIQSVAKSDRSDSSQGVGDDLTSLHSQVLEFKYIFAYLMGIVLERVGEEALTSNENQQYLHSLADIAIEIYVTESTVLRVLKLNAHQTDRNTELPEALARLYFEYSADRIRQEATEIASDLFDGDQLREELSTINAWLPLPTKRFDLRKYVAETVVEAQGALPEYQN